VEAAARKKVARGCMVLNKLPSLREMSIIIMASMLSNPARKPARLEEILGRGGKTANAIRMNSTTIAPKRDVATEYMNMLLNKFFPYNVKNHI